MKGFLLLSLGLLLVISASASSIANEKPETRGSSILSGASQSPGGASSSIAELAPSTGNSSQPSGTTQPPGGANSSIAGLTQPPTNITLAPTNSSLSPTNSSLPPTNSSLPPTNSSVPPTNSSLPPTNSPLPPTNITLPPTNSSVPPTNSSLPPTNSPLPPTNTSQPPGTTQPPGGTVTNSSSTGPSGPCNPDPCKGGASCVKLHNESFCLCLEGYYYNKSSLSCVKGKIFPGEVSMNLPETADLEDKNSMGYQELHDNVIQFFKSALNMPDYGQTVILKVGPAPSVSARSAMLVYVSVVNMFRENTMLTEANVTSAIHSAFEKNDTMVKSYFSQDLCDYYGCVKNDITKCQDGLQCPCKPGLERQNPQVPFCVAVTCSEPCNAEDKKQCLKTDNGTMECVCMPGYQKANNNGKCEECPFGYSGMDCKDQFQLILTIVGTIAGALILILLITLIISTRSKNKKKNIEEQRLIEDDFQNLRLRQTGFSNLGADTSIFPKVRTGQTPNPYANQRSMPRPDY